MSKHGRPAEEETRIGNLILLAVTGGLTAAALIISFNDSFPAG